MALNDAEFGTRVAAALVLREVIIAFANRLPEGERKAFVDEVQLAATRALDEAPNIGGNAQIAARDLMTIAFSERFRVRDRKPRRDP